MGALFWLTVWESLGSVLFTLYDQTTPTENDIHLAFNPYHDELVNLNDMWSSEDIDKLLDGLQAHNWLTVKIVLRWIYWWYRRRWTWLWQRFWCSDVNSRLFIVLNVLHVCPNFIQNFQFLVGIKFKDHESLPLVISDDG